MSDIDEPAYTAAESEGLSENRLFLELRKHADLFGVACGRGSFFVAPHNSTLQDVDRSTIAAHILQPKGEGSNLYYTLDGRTVRLEPGALITMSGFATSSRIRVIAEETYYGDGQRPMRALLLDAALVGSKPSSDRPPLLWLEEDCSRYLASLPSSFKSISALGERVYDLLQVMDTERGFEQRLVSVIRAVSMEFAQQLLSVASVGPLLRQRPWMHAAVQHALENVVAAELSEKILLALHDQYRADDECVVRWAAATNPNTLGLPVKPSPAAAAAAAKHMESCERARSPSEKLYYVVRAMRAAARRLTGEPLPSGSAAVGTDDSQQQEEVSVLGGDDMLPLALYVILVSRLRNAASLARYLQFFLPDAAGASQSAYMLATFGAAVRYAATNAPQRTAATKPTRPLSRSEQLQKGGESAVAASLLAAGVVVDSRMLARLSAKPEQQRAVPGRTLLTSPLPLTRPLTQGAPTAAAAGDVTSMNAAAAGDAAERTFADAVSAAATKESDSSLSSSAPVLWSTR